jgi:hypothetical protein
MSRFTSLLGSLCVVAAGLSAVACNRVHVEPVRGPDGSNDWQSISCTHMNKKCFRMAEALCPNGYYFARAAGPAPGYAPRGDDGEWASSSRGATALAPTPQAGVNTRTLPPQERWDSSMYTRKGGTILVQCADARATASR